MFLTFRHLKPYFLIWFVLIWFVLKIKRVYVMFKNNVLADVEKSFYAERFVFFGLITLASKGVDVIFWCSGET